jgi:hypothetical protein
VSNNWVGVGAEFGIKEHWIYCTFVSLFLSGVSANVQRPVDRTDFVRISKKRAAAIMPGALLPCGKSTLFWLATWVARLDPGRPGLSCHRCGEV